MASDSHAEATRARLAVLTKVIRTFRTLKPFPLPYTDGENGRRWLQEGSGGVVRVVR